MQESLYHGVPILAMPYAIDQVTQAAKVEAKGFGLRLDLAPELTSKEIVTLKLSNFLLTK